MSPAAREKISLPDYTRGEEIMNMTTHIVGAAFGVFALVMCLIKSVSIGSPYAIVGSLVYGIALIWLYTMSSVYHGLVPCDGKRVMRVLDHCTINFLIAGTYTPILLVAMRPIAPVLTWVIFGIEWGLCILATTLTAIDLKRYAKLGMACYIGMGWCVIVALRVALEALSPIGFLWVLLGGVAYTLGAVFYGFGKRHRYIHSVFHIFVVIASVLQYIGVYFFALRA